MPLSTRDLISWTPARALSARQAAEGGDLYEAAMLVTELLTDDRVRGALAPLIEGLFGLPIQWSNEEPPGWFKLAPETELAKIVRWGRLLGIGIASIKDNGALEAWDMQHFRVDMNTRQWYARTRKGEVPIEFGTGEWVAYTPFGAIDPHMQGLWLTLVLPWLIKRFSLHDRARASEVFGSAMIVGTAPEGSTESMRTKWLNDLRTLAKNSRLVLPDVDYKLDLLEAQGQTWGIYDQAISWADGAITVTIAGQTVTVEGTKGFARGDVHERVARSLLRYTAETFSTCLGEQYIPHVWGQEENYPHWVTASPDELIGEGNALTALASGIADMNAQLAIESKRVDIAALAKKYGIRTIDLEQAIKAPNVKLDSVADVVITVDEARAALGVGPAAADGALTVAQYRARAEGVAPAPEAAPVEASGPVTEEEIADTAEPTDRIKLADDLTRLQIDACRHGKKNNCPLCKIRRRDLAPPFKGAPFPLVWEPVLASAVMRNVGSLAASIRAGATYRDPGTAEPMREFRVFSYGGNLTNHRPTYLTPEGAASIVRAFAGRDVMIDLEHLSNDPSATNYDPDARGWARLECREDGLWAIDVRWTPEGEERIASGKQRYISPFYDVTPAGVIVKLTNLALTALPAMYFPPRVAA